MELLPGERLDELQRNGYRIIQRPDQFCFGVDAVLLTSFAVVKPGEDVLDLGTGTGVIPILLKGKTKGRRFVGLEIQADSADMARRSAYGNGLEDVVDIRRGDIKGASALFGNATFDVVTVNPPYMNDKHGLVNPEEPKAIARHEVACTLEDVAREASKVLKQKGRFYMVYRPRRMVEMVLALSQHRLEPKRMRFVHPYADKEPHLVLVEAVKGGRPHMRVEKPLILHCGQGGYTDEVKEWYGF